MIFPIIEIIKLKQFPQILCLVKPLSEISKNPSNKIEIKEKISENMKIAKVFVMIPL